MHARNHLWCNLVMGCMNACEGCMLETIFDVTWSWGACEECMLETIFGVTWSWGACEGCMLETIFGVTWSWGIGWELIMGQPLEKDTGWC